MRGGEFPNLPLKRLMRPISAGVVSIKGHLEELADDEGFPGYSASGQDVRLPEPRFSGEGLVLSAVGAQCGKCFYASGQWGVVANTQAFLPTELGHVRYLYFLVNQRDFWEVGGTAQPYVQVPRSMCQAVPAPPLDVQRRIARFLDEKTARIDGLIEKKRALLDRLAEKRQALITRAVTKGLNPDAPMKPSGIAWLGDIPGHWEVKRLKYISPRVTVGIVITPAAFYADEGVLAIRGLNLRAMDFDFTDLRNISEEGHELHLKSELHEGDLVAVRTGDPGTTSVITAYLEGTNCVDLVIIRRSPNASSRFLGWFLNSSAAKVQYVLGSEGALQLHFNIETSKEVVVAVPPIEEQILIAEHIDRRLEYENERAAKVERSADLLGEYRAALITAAVSGQLPELL